jgi:hypothetical protein
MVIDAAVTSNCVFNPNIVCYNTNTGYFAVAIPIGQSIALVGAIFAGAGFAVEHLRPLEVRKTEDASLRESDSQKP